MSEPIIRDQSGSADRPDGPITMLNRFTAKPGQLDAFIAAQKAEYVRLKGQVPGWLGNRLLLETDGLHVVNVADFSSYAEYTEWRNSALFSDHLEIIRPFLVKAEPVLYTVLYDAAVVA